MFCRPSVKESKNTQEILVKTKNMCRELNMKIKSLDNQKKSIEESGRCFIEKGDEERAEAESFKYLKIEETRKQYIDLHTKMCLLVEDIDRITTVNVCVNTLSDMTTSVTSFVNNMQTIQDIDMQFSKLEIAIEKVSIVSKELSKPVKISSNVSKKQEEIIIEMPTIPLQPLKETKEKLLEL